MDTLHKRASRLTVTGRVQGVGFRPFVYRIAMQHGITGWVQNHQGRVAIHIEGEEPKIASFIHDLIHTAPPLAHPQLESDRPVEPEADRGFEIRRSAQDDSADIHIPPDQFTCDECLQELGDPTDRRYRYPFINCTQCGPRYTLIERVPYDRPNTSMAGFPLCPACEKEYRDPLDRRFHAEPVACPDCGPRLELVNGQGHIEHTREALRVAVEALYRGEIVAVKGIGGYHLLCDARSDSAVARLRQRKRRPGKPLAVMFPFSGEDGLGAIRQELQPRPEESGRLLEPERPIILCQQRQECTLDREIAPGLREVGAMLPYSPLHHLLLNDFGGPLVATSGNISGEPVITENSEAEKRLSRIADHFLHHNRPILRPADDSLYRVINGRARSLRLGRGSAPLELSLPSPLPFPTLAVGGQMKNSIALAWEKRIVISPHIGDLDSPRSQQIFSQVIAELQRLYGVVAKQLVCDAHPGYASSRWARSQGLPLIEVYHHHAHASALYGEQTGDGDWLLFTWDGVGYGADQTLWGGESLIGSPGHWQRFGSLRPFRLPGGEKAGREPWRSAAACCWEAGIEWDGLPGGDELLRQAWKKGINTPVTTAAGRLFDCASALLGLCQNASFEGEGPMRLEATADRVTDGIKLPLAQNENGLWITDWSPLLPELLNEGTTIAKRAGLFHASLADAIVEQALTARDQCSIEDIGLSGGVFQNRLLCELTTAKLERAGFNVHLAELIPVNDGGLCYGQIIESIYHQPSSNLPYV